MQAGFEMRELEAVSAKWSLGAGSWNQLCVKNDPTADHLPLRIISSEWDTRTAQPKCLEMTTKFVASLLQTRSNGVQPIESCASLQQR